MSRLERAVRGTMHGNRQPLPPLARLGIALTVLRRLDTDHFGTFTG